MYVCNVNHIGLREHEDDYPKGLYRFQMLSVYFTDVDRYSPNTKKLVQSWLFEILFNLRK